MNVCRFVIIGTAALAGCGVLGLVPDTVQASSLQAATWTQQAPATSPPARIDAAMAYDAATGSAVLFGGYDGHHGLDDTWTWNGTTWTQEHPAVHPPNRVGASMAYDPATGTAVLFGGYGCCASLDATWTWNGTTWAEQIPRPSPPTVRIGPTMAYDAATGTVVLFGGISGDGRRIHDDTWTWNGATWTKQHPAARPAARYDAVMAYDAAAGTAALFGGHGSHGLLGNTWTWDGTNWTQQALAAHPDPRSGAVMAYGAATSTAVLFGGGGSRHVFGDTWTWG